MNDGERLARVEFRLTKPPEGDEGGAMKKRFDALEEQSSKTIRLVPR